jgi:predicted amidohydrolase
MTRSLKIAAAQLGPIQRADSRASIIGRLLALMREAKAMGADLVVYPELALSAFFTKWYIPDEEELERTYFEREMPGPDTRVLFDEAAKLGIGFHLGYAELAVENGVKHRYNTAILVDDHGRIVGKYRKIHLPGHPDYRPEYPIQDLEKMYFEIGNLGFPVFAAFGGVMWLCICNDRRWPETYRVMGLQGVEMILCGYNTPIHNPMAPSEDHLQGFQNHLSMQAGAYQNGAWVEGVAKCGVEDGWEMIGQSAIIAPSGEIVAMCSTLEDEIAFARCDLDKTHIYKNAVFNFAAHRRPEHYSLITERAGAVAPFTPTPRGQR